MPLPEVTILTRVVEKLKLVNGQAPYMTDFGQRVYQVGAVDPAEQKDTPFVLVGWSNIEPGQTDGAGIITVIAEVTIGPDYWVAAAVDPQVALLNAQGDIRECLGVQHRSLDGALYRGPNSRLNAVRAYATPSGGSRLSTSVSWRYIFHATKELNG